MTRATYQKFSPEYRRPTTKSTFAVFPQAQQQLEQQQRCLHSDYHRLHCPSNAEKNTSNEIESLHLSVIQIENCANKSQNRSFLTGRFAAGALIFLHTRNKCLNNQRFSMKFTENL